LRIAVAIFFIECAVNLLKADHRAVLSQELSVIIGTLRRATLWATTYFFLYIALEPYVRRRWPEKLVAWSRLLAGNVRDPLVGRDMLIGITAGVAHGTLASLSHWIPSRFGLALPDAPHATSLDTLLGVRHALATIVGLASSGIIFGLVLIVILIGLAIVFRRRSFAAVGLYLLQLSIYAVASGGNRYIFASSIFIAAIWTLVTVRIGLLGIATAQTIFGAVFFMTISIDASSWMLPSTIAPVVFVALLTAFAFRTALGGQAMFSAKLLDE
jgi:serine/threonine-protein kinase